MIFKQPRHDGITVDEMLKQENRLEQHMTPREIFAQGVHYALAHVGGDTDTDYLYEDWLADLVEQHS